MNSTATSNCGPQKLGNNVWHDSESIATNYCSQICRKWNTMFESHVETTQTSIDRTSINFLFGDFLAICQGFCLYKQSSSVLLTSYLCGLCKVFVKFILVVRINSCQVYSKSPSKLYLLQCDQLTSSCCIQVQVATLQLCINPEILQLCIEPRHEARSSWQVQCLIQYELLCSVGLSI